MKKFIRSALAVATLAMAIPAAATETVAVRPREEKTVEKQTVDSLQQKIAALEQAVDNLAKSAVERDVRQAKFQAQDENSLGAP
jgi:predicted lipoprotein